MGMNLLILPCNHPPIDVIIHTFASNFPDMKLQFILPLFISLGQLAAQPVSLETASPDGQVRVRLSLGSNGEPSYSVSFMGKEVHRRTRCYFSL